MTLEDQLKERIDKAFAIAKSLYGSPSRRSPSSIQHEMFRIMQALKPDNMVSR